MYGFHLLLLLGNLKSKSKSLALLVVKDSLYIDDIWKLVVTDFLNAKLEGCMKYHCDILAKTIKFARTKLTKLIQLKYIIYQHYCCYKL